MITVSILSEMPPSQTASEEMPWNQNAVYFRGEQYPTHHVEDLWSDARFRLHLAYRTCRKWLPCQSWDGQVFPSTAFQCITDLVKTGHSQSQDSNNSWAAEEITLKHHTYPSTGTWTHTPRDCWHHSFPGPGEPSTTFCPIRAAALVEPALRQWSPISWSLMGGSGVTCPFHTCLWKHLPCAHSMYCMVYS